MNKEIIKLEKLVQDLDCNEYDAVMTDEQIAYAKENSIVVVFATSDDKILFKGAINKEFPARAEGYADQGNHIYVHNGVPKTEHELQGIVMTELLDIFIDYEIQNPEVEQTYSIFSPNIATRDFCTLFDGKQFCECITFSLLDLELKQTNSLYDVALKAFRSLIDTDNAHKVLLVEMVSLKDDAILYELSLIPNEDPEFREYKTISLIKSSKIPLSEMAALEHFSTILELTSQLRIILDIAHKEAIILTDDPEDQKDDNTFENNIQLSVSTKVVKLIPIDPKSTNN